MRYWVYINDKVDGPYEEDKLVTLGGFSQDTLICSEEVASQGKQEWVKASSIFEFDEIPVQEEPTPTSSAQNSSTAGTVAMDTSVLLAKLESLSAEVSHLNEKLDSMQTHLDEALEQNKQLAQQVAQPPHSAPLSTLSNEEEPSLPADTPTQTTDEQNAQEASALEQPTSFPEQAAPKEEELIIRSALDSIYGEKPVQSAPVEKEAFQDLLPQKETQEEEQAAVEKISEELTFTPLEEEKPITVQAALITTPSAEEASKDALINELTASPHEDILDQIIQERQSEQSHENPTEEENSSALSGGVIAGAGAVVAGAAAAAFIHSDKEPEATPNENEVFSMATDKNAPDLLENVLPASQMPEDVPAPDTAPANMNALPSLEEHAEDLPVQEDVIPVQESEDASHEDTLQELVPSAQTEDAAAMQEEVSSPAENVAPVMATTEPEEVMPTEEKPTPLAESDFSVTEESAPTPEEVVPVPEEVAPDTQETAADQELQEKELGITEKDLTDAFGPDAVPAASEAISINNNPNELTEIELKEGSTYLISDFVPPAQFTDNNLPEQEQGGNPAAENKLQETLIQDMLAVSSTAEKTHSLATDGLPDDLSATQVSLENTIQAKRGASLDIKTVPMVPEPANSSRLDMNDLDDVNAQHDMKTTKSATSLTKIVLAVLVGFLLLMILYVLLGMLHLLPGSINLFAPKEQVAGSQVTQEFVGNDSQPQGAQEEPSPLEQKDNTDVLSKVQEFPLPNGMTLAQFIAAKHAGIDAQLISWEISDGVEEDNYSVTVKVPPENPQNFKTVYRFNYNIQNGMLEPTISDAKNLLDQAYGQQ